MDEAVRIIQVLPGARLNALLNWWHFLALRTFVRLGVGHFASSLSAPSLAFARRTYVRGSHADDWSRNYRTESSRSQTNTFQYLRLNSELHSLKPLPLRHTMYLCADVYIHNHERWITTDYSGTLAHQDSNSYWCKGDLVAGDVHAPQETHRSVSIPRSKRSNAFSFAPFLHQEETVVSLWFLLLFRQAFQGQWTLRERNTDSENPVLGNFQNHAKRKYLQLCSQDFQPDLYSWRWAPSSHCSFDVELRRPGSDFECRTSGSVSQGGAGTIVLKSCGVCASINSFWHPLSDTRHLFLSANSFCSATVCSAHSLLMWPLTLFLRLLIHWGAEKPLSVLSQVEASFQTWFAMLITLRQIDGHRVKPWLP